MRKLAVRVCAVAALAAVLVGCGDDDDETAATPTTEQPGDDGNGDGGDVSATFCADYQELLAGDPGPEEIREVAAGAPEDARDPLERIAAGFESDPEGYFMTEEFGESFAEVGEVVVGECAEREMEVTAVDYAFEGLDDEVEAGTVGITLKNEGEEFHEIIVFRKNDDTTESFDEILEMEDEGAIESLVEQRGATFAPPGGESSGLFELDAGEYIAICFIPVGSTPDAESESEGPPHFTQGMKAEFTVS
jgi:hypothetical protein